MKGVAGGGLSRAGLDLRSEPIAIKKVEFPDGKSPANPFLQPGETPRVRASRGFEAMAASPDGRRLYPIVEGSFTDDPDLRRRFIYEFDNRTGSYTGRTWQYETDTDNNVIRAVDLDTGRGPAEALVQALGRIVPGPALSRRR